jgi:hypothetical protein
MTSHISDELPRLLSGEAARDEVLTAAAHLRECEDCRQELVSSVVAHATLTSAQRFAPEVVNAIRDLTPEQPSAALPDLSGVFAQVRQEAAASSAPTRAHRRVPLRAVAAIAAGLLIGAGSVAIADHTGSSASGRSIALAAFDTGHSNAKATIVSGAMKIDASSLPRLDASRRYEVWLTNSARTRMQPVGWIGSNGKASLTIPQNLMSTYTAIEVSVQSVDASTYTFSGVSVLRGTYRT